MIRGRPARVVRVVGVVDRPEPEVRELVRRRLPSDQSGWQVTVVSTPAGVLVTLAADYSGRPGARRQAVRRLQHRLAELLASEP